MNIDLDKLAKDLEERFPMHEFDLRANRTHVFVTIAYKLPTLEAYPRFLSYETDSNSVVIDYLKEYMKTVDWNSNLL